MNSEDSAPDHDLTGRILVSSPTLHDPNFIHTLVYIAQHSRGARCYEALAQEVLQLW